MKKTYVESLFESSFNSHILYIVIFVLNAQIIIDWKIIVLGGSNMEFFKMSCLVSNLNILEKEFDHHFFRVGGMGQRLN